MLNNKIKSNKKLIILALILVVILPALFAYNNKYSANSLTTVSVTNMLLSKEGDGANYQIFIDFSQNVSETSSVINIIGTVGNSIIISGKTLTQINNEYGAGKAQVWILPSNLKRLQININKVSFNDYSDINSDFIVTVSNSFVADNGVSINEETSKKYLQKYLRFTNNVQTQVNATNLTFIKSADGGINSFIYVFFDKDITDNAYMPSNIFNSVKTDIKINGKTLEEIQSLYSNSIEVYLSVSFKNRLQINLRKANIAAYLNTDSENFNIEISENFTGFNGAVLLEGINKTYLQNFNRFIETEHAYKNINVSHLTFHKNVDGGINHHLRIFFDDDIIDDSFSGGDSVNAFKDSININGLSLGQINTLYPNSVQIWFTKDYKYRLHINLVVNNITAFHDFNKDDFEVEITNDFTAYNGTVIEESISKTYYQSYNAFLDTVPSGYVDITNADVLLNMDNGSNHWIRLFFDSPIVGDYTPGTNVRQYVENFIYINGYSLKEIYDNNRTQSMANPVDCYIVAINGEFTLLRVNIKTAVASEYNLRLDNSDIIEIKDGFRTLNNKQIVSEIRYMYDVQSDSLVEPQLFISQLSAIEIENQRKNIYVAFKPSPKQTGVLEQSQYAYLSLNNDTFAQLNSSQAENVIATWVLKNGEYVLKCSFEGQLLNNDNIVFKVLSGFTSSDSFTVKSDYSKKYSFEYNYWIKDINFIFPDIDMQIVSVQPIIINKFGDSIIKIAFNKQLLMNIFALYDIANKDVYHLLSQTDYKALGYNYSISIIENIILSDIRNSVLSNISFNNKTLAQMIAEENKSNAIKVNYTFNEITLIISGQATNALKENKKYVMEIKKGVRSYDGASTKFDSKYVFDYKNNVWLLGDKLPYEDNNDDDEQNNPPVQTNPPLQTEKPQDREQGCFGSINRENIIAFLLLAISAIVILPIKKYLTKYF